MKGWKLMKPLTVAEKEFNEDSNSTNVSKVKITKSLVTLSDYLRYADELENKGVILGSYGIGVVTEANTNLFGLEKGKHVYIEPTVACGECHNCKNNEEYKCTDTLTAGEDVDGFLRDFISTDSSKLHVLPESVTDFEALFIGQISLAIAVCDKLDIKKGDYVTIIGANNFANILAQLLIYYQAVPIVLSMNEERLQIARDSGIYYTLGKDDNWQKEVSVITGGRMTNKVVYISDCNIPVAKAFSLASFNASVVFTGVSYKNSPISFMQAIKKQLDIHCVNTGFGNTAASINIIANKAINLSHLKLDSTTYDKVPQVFDKMHKTYKKDGYIYETIVDMF